ncbi:MAG: hypothetical protein RLZZ501_2503 [Pseudomonadota bacterium]|jgi:hypothetical protein
MADETLREYFVRLGREVDRAVAPYTSLSFLPYATSQDYCWVNLDPDGAFNQRSFACLSCRVERSPYPPAEAPQAPSSFPNGYIQMITALYYALGPAEQAVVAQARQRAAAAGVELPAVRGPRPAAGSSPHFLDGAACDPDIRLGAEIATEWSGAAAPLALEDLARAAAPFDLLPNAPAGAAGTEADLKRWLDAWSPALGAVDRMFAGMWRLSRVRANTATPSATNGGMRIFDPATGAVLPDHYQIAYRVAPASGDVGRQLADVTRTIRVEMASSLFAGAGIVLRYLCPAASAGLALTDQDSFLLSILYRGFALIEASPAAFDPDTACGWYDGAMIAEAIANQGTTQAGYHFVTDPPPYDPMPGGTLGAMAHLLIANPPEIRITGLAETHPLVQAATRIQPAAESAPGRVTLFDQLSPGGGRALYRLRRSDGAVVLAPIPPSAQPFTRALAEDSPWLQAAEVVAGVTLWPGVPPGGVALGC